MQAAVRKIPDKKQASAEACFFRTLPSETAYFVRALLAEDSGAR
jgi:hypothetical protein